MSQNSPDIYHVNLAGGLALAWVNSYSGTVIKTPGATLLFDPVSLAVPEDVSLDLIAISHGHTDHWDPPLVTALHQRTRAVVATSCFLASRVPALSPQAGETASTLAGPGNSGSNPHSGPHPDSGATCSAEKPLPGSVIALEPGEWVRVGDVTVAALRCDHAAEEPLSFLVRTDDDLVVYLPGDSTPFPTMSRLPSVPLPRSSSSSMDGRQSEMPVDVLLWMGTALEDGARIARLVQPKVLVSYAIAPPAAGVRARGLLTRLTPDVPVYTLERNQVFVYPPEP
jgi:hypothetical protein